MSVATKLAAKLDPAPVYFDPFHPVLKVPNQLSVNDEQELYLREILDICCSDSRFAQKAYVAILAVLTQSTPEVLPPTLTSVSPNTGEVGLVPVPIVVVGTEFDSTSKVLYDGMVLNSTLFVSETVLNAELFMEDKLAGDHLIAVDKGGVISNTVPFTVTDPVVLMSASVETQKKETSKEILLKKAEEVEHKPTITSKK